MEFFFLIVVLFGLASASFFLDFTSPSSSTGTGGSSLLGPILDEEDDSQAFDQTIHPTDQFQPLINIKSVWNSYDMY